MALSPASTEQMIPPPLSPTESPVHAGVEASRLPNKELQTPESLLQANQLMIDTSREYRFEYRIDSRADQLKIMKQRLDSGKLTKGEAAQLQQQYDVENALFQRDYKNWEAIESASVTDNSPGGVDKKVRGLAVAQQFWTEQSIKAENEKTGDPILDAKVIAAQEDYKKKANSAENLRSDIRSKKVLNEKISDWAAIKSIKRGINFIAGSDPVPGLTDESSLQLSLARDETASNERWKGPYASTSTTDLLKQIQEEKNGGNPATLAALESQLKARQRGSETMARLSISLADQRAAIYERKTEQDKAREARTQKLKTEQSSAKSTEEKAAKPASNEALATQIKTLIESLSKPSPSDLPDLLRAMLKATEGETQKKSVTRGEIIANLIMLLLTNLPAAEAAA